MFLTLFWKSCLKYLGKGASTGVIFFIFFYKVFLSTTLTMGGACRFYPSCSHYAALVYKQHSFFKASKLLIKRLLSCHPFGPKVREESELQNLL